LTSRRRFLSLLGMLAISAACFGAMRALGLLRWQDAAQAFRERSAWVLGGAAAQLVVAALGIVRCGLLLALFGVTAPWRRVAGATLLSQGIGQFLPGSMAATELIRVGLLLGAGRRGVTSLDPDLSARLVLASVLDRILGLGAMMVFGGITGAALMVAAPPRAVVVAIAYAAVSLLLGTFMLTLPVLGTLWPGAVGGPVWGGGGVTPLARVLARLHGLRRVWVAHSTQVARAPGKLVLAALLGAISLPVSCLTVWLPAASGPMPLPFWPLAAVVPLLSLATVLPMGLAGFGSQQAFAALALAAFGVDSKAVVTASLIQNVVVLLVGSALAGVAALLFARDLRGLRQAGASHPPAP
jgi:hypothetical protein